MLINGSHATNTKTYSSLVEATLGPAAGKTLQVAITSLCFGLMIIFLVVIGDILTGSASAAAGSGLLSEITGAVSGPLTERKLVIAGVAVGICSPLMALR